MISCLQIETYTTWARRNGTPRSHRRTRHDFLTAAGYRRLTDASNICTQRLDNDPKMIMIPSAAAFIFMHRLDEAGAFYDQAIYFQDQKVRYQLVVYARPIFNFDKLPDREDIAIDFGPMD